MSDLITRRPQRGSAYARDATYTNDHWNKISEPGGRRLWFKLVIGFTLMAVFGTALLALGSVLFQHAYNFHEEGNTALPMVLCIISIVCGVLMFFGSIILGKLVISSKWRKNQQPDYGRRAARVRYTIPADDNPTAQVEIDLPPPPYETNGSHRVQTAIFFVNGDLHISANMPPPPDLMLNPPEYSEESVKPPSYSSLSGVHMITNYEHNTLPNEQQVGAERTTNTNSVTE